MDIDIYSYLIDEQVGHRRKTAGHSLELKRKISPVDADLEVADFHLAVVVAVVEAEHDADCHILNVDVKASVSGNFGKAKEADPRVNKRRGLPHPG